MRKVRTIALVLLAAVFAASVQAGASRAAELVMFEKDGCVWCQRWHQEIGEGYPHSDEGKKAPLRVFKMTGPSAVESSLKAPVTHAPTFVLLANGREVGRIVGYPGADFFYGMLGELLQKSSRQSGEQHRPETVKARPAT